MLLQSLLRPVLTPIMTGVMAVMSVRRAWSPASLLFADDESGAMLPLLSDFSKLFQDSAGTIPVTSIGQPVGKALDASGNGKHFTFTGVTIERDVDGFHYLALSNSTGVTPSIDLTATNKVTYFFSHRKESASTSIPLEFGDNSYLTAGTFGYWLNLTGSNDVSLLRGTDAAEYPTVAAGAAPVFNVVSNRIDLSAATAELRHRIRINGSAMTHSAGGSAPGGGSFTAQVLNVGQRADGSNKFAGRIYGLIVRGVDTTDEDTQTVEAFLASSGSNSARYTASVLALGDSTVAEYASGTAILGLMVAITGTTSASSGDSIADQKAVWQALSSGVKTGQDAVFIQASLNDVGYTEAASAVIARLQDLVDTVLSDVPETCRVYISQMTPCKQRWIDLFGSTNGAIAQQQWFDINAAIAGNGATPITGVSGRITAHVDPMSDGSGNLNASYDTGDHIHPNTAGRQINADAWQARIVADGLM